MTKVFSKKNNDFYDDYAHHPTEIKSILEGVKNVNPKRKIISVFEPHRYSRIISLKDEFSKCFSCDFEELILANAGTNLITTKQIKVRIDIIFSKE